MATRLAIKETKMQAVVLLRYHTAKPRSTSKVYASYAEITRIVKMPYSTVRTLCLRAATKTACQGDAQALFHNPNG